MEQKNKKLTIVIVILTVLLCLSVTALTLIDPTGQPSEPTTAPKEPEISAEPTPADTEPSVTSAPEPETESSSDISNTTEVVNNDSTDISDPVSAESP